MYGLMLQKMNVMMLLAEDGNNKNGDGDFYIDKGNDNVSEV